MELRKASKTQSKLRIGMAGTAGSGKTYSSLLMASGMTDWDKIAIIDTENGSADLYSHLGAYNVITLTAPFTPERYIEAVHACEDAGMEVIIIDSITHEWDGTGGILQIHEQMGGNSFTAWGKLTPRHNAFVQAILQSPAHIITTVRRKQDYSMETVDGKTKVTKQGLKEVTREGFEYELTLSFAIGQNHLALASKDRTGLFMDKPEFVISKATGELLKNWAESGVKTPPVTKPVQVPTTPEPDFEQQMDTLKQDASTAWLEEEKKPEPTKQDFIDRGEKLRQIAAGNPDNQPEKPCPLPQHVKRDGSAMMMKYRVARQAYSHARQVNGTWEYCDGEHGFPSDKLSKDTSIPV